MGCVCATEKPNKSRFKRVREIIYEIVPCEPASINKCETAPINKCEQLQ